MSGSSKSRRVGRRFAMRAAAVAVALAGCASRAPAVQDPVSFDVAREAAQTTAPTQPLRAVFRWSMVDPESRFSGDGVARIAPEYMARIDLFGPRGDGYLMAALVGDRLTLPPNADPDVPVPPPALLWSTIGVFKPPQGAELVSTRRDGRTTRLEYRNGTDRWRFTLRDGRLASAELETGGRRHTVELGDSGAQGLPSAATYRDWAAFRELKLTLESVEPTHGFSPEIWTLDGN